MEGGVGPRVHHLMYQTVPVGEWGILQSIGKGMGFAQGHVEEQRLTSDLPVVFGVLCFPHLLTHHTFLCPFLTAPDVSYVFFCN